MLGRFRPGHFGDRAFQIALPGRDFEATFLSAFDTKNDFVGGVGAMTNNQTLRVEDHSHRGRSDRNPLSAESELPNRESRFCFAGGWTGRRRIWTRRGVIEIDRNFFKRRILCRDHTNGITRQNQNLAQTFVQQALQLRRVRGKRLRHQGKHCDQSARDNGSRQCGRTGPQKASFRFTRSMYLAHPRANPRHPTK